MKFRVEREVLAEAVAWVARALPNRPPSPVLLGVLVEANDDQSVTLSAFDYEVSARTTIEADVSGTVLAIKCESGQPVEFDQPLFVIG